MEPIADRIDIVLVDQDRLAGNQISVEITNNKFVMLPALGEIYKEDFDIASRPRLLTNIAFNCSDVRTEVFGEFIEKRKRVVSNFEAMIG